MSNPLFILILAGGLAFVLLLVGVIVTITTDRKNSVDDRIQRYTSAQEARQDQAVKTRMIADWMNRRVEKTTAGGRISKELSRADLKLKPGEYVGLMVLSAIVAGAFVWLLTGKLLLLAILGAIFGAFIPRMYVKRQQGKRLVKFNNQLPDMINLMVNGLRAGFSTMQAMEAVSKELPPPICDEFRRVVQEMQLGITMERALENLLVRIPSDDLDMVITAINVQREVGGNLAEILDTISYTIRERVRIKGEIRVLTTQVMYSGRFLSVLPLIVLAILFGINRDYMMEFFKPESVPCGYIALGLSAILIASGYFAMTKLGDIEI